MANWLNDVVRPKIRAAFVKRDTPDNLWTKCPGCGQMLFHRELAENLNVCHHCGHHMRFGLSERIELILDPGFTLVPIPEVQLDPLKFRDEKRYTDRLKDARAKTGQNDAMAVAYGTVNGLGAVLAVQNFAFMGGSMGLAVGEALIAAAERAVDHGVPLIVVTAAGGARMQEGILSLMQMPRSTVAVEMLRDAKLPYIVVLTDPTTGGVTASFAMLGDIQMAEPGALIGFAGQRVIEQTIREKLPEGFQRAEYLLEHGIIDMVVPRKEMKERLTKVVSLLMNRRPPPAVKLPARA
ncbi:acetyl-CoA carboxylase carboxyltransferase subunit beta [Oleomonas cavernae]|uniref:Acetyl-coenzyme A carboxylase carboxyl transferase subunit beta n=1 Tax=Oleomonas cavernae TaxID=2320859 RepID=A0A418WT11_9PROT|nr:acetyl-CoA carboxylase, carboxyltransferase subunit beta [Oleomonas cavernae]RJF94390.1 acetyl-CoA carboxylase carboxyltransferase subunit beta [Oleomonas cavernae]